MHAMATRETLRMNDNAKPPFRPRKHASPEMAVANLERQTPPPRHEIALDLSPRGGAPTEGEGVRG